MNQTNAEPNMNTEQHKENQAKAESPTSDFRPPRSELRVPISDFRLPTSALRAPRSLIKLLIVEDSPVAREFLTYIFTSDPAIQVVGTAGNGVEALEMVRRKKPDVITMDIHMPLMDGFEATRRRLRPDRRADRQAGHHPEDSRGRAR